MRRRLRKVHAPDGCVPDAAKVVRVQNAREYWLDYRLLLQRDEPVVDVHAMKRASMKRRWPMIVFVGAAGCSSAVSTHATSSTNGGASGGVPRAPSGGASALGGTNSGGGTTALGGASGSGGVTVANGGSGATSSMDAGPPPVCSNAVQGRFMPTSTMGAASARFSPTLTWTGSSMLVYDVCNNGTDALYSPCADSWQPLVWTRSSCATVTLEAPPFVDLLGGTPATFTELDGASATASNRSVDGMPTTTLPTAVATNTGLIVWGGTTLLPNSNGNVASNAGAVYDRNGDRWRAVSTAGAPSPRIAPGAWSPNGFVVWGGHSATSIETDAGRYDCLGDTLPPCSLYQDGAIYDPAGDRWTSMGAAGDLPSPRRDAVVAWVGDKILIWGGMGGSPYGFTLNGALYDTVSRSWTKATPLPDSAVTDGIVWTGSRIVVTGNGNLVTWTYVPGALAWTSVPSVVGAGLCNTPSVSHGALVSLCESSTGASSVVALLEDGATAWKEYPVPGGEIEQPGLLWNGTELFLWGGAPPTLRGGCPPGVGCDPEPPVPLNSGYFLRP